MDDGRKHGDENYEQLRAATHVALGEEFERRCRENAQLAENLKKLALRETNLEVLAGYVEGAHLAAMRAAEYAQVVNILLLESHPAAVRRAFDAARAAATDATTANTRWRVMKKQHPGHAHA